MREPKAPGSLTQHLRGFVSDMVLGKSAELLSQRGCSILYSCNPHQGPPRRLLGWTSESVLAWGDVTLWLTSLFWGDQWQTQPWVSADCAPFLLRGLMLISSSTRKPSVGLHSPCCYGRKDKRQPRTWDLIQLSLGFTAVRVSLVLKNNHTTDLFCS